MLSAIRCMSAADILALQISQPSPETVEEKALNALDVEPELLFAARNRWGDFQLHHDQRTNGGNEPASAGRPVASEAL